MMVEQSDNAKIVTHEGGSMDIVQLLYHPGSLPSIPRVLALVLSEINRPEPDLMQISTQIGQDPVLTARVLALANTAEHYRGRSVSTPAQAIAMLGIHQVRDMVLAASLSLSFKEVAEVPLHRYWRFGLNVAKTMRLLTRYRNLGPLPFTAGLLSSIGTLVIARGMPDAIRAVNAKTDLFALERAETETQMIGYCYAHVGAGFVRHWRLGEELASIIESQEDPLGPTSTNGEPIACMLRLATWRCRAYESALSEKDLIATFPAAVAQAVGLDFPTVMAIDPAELGSSAEADELTS